MKHYLLPAAAVAGLLWAAVVASHDLLTPTSSLTGPVKVKLLFDPAHANWTPAAKPAGGGSQPGQEWDGTAAEPDTTGLTGTADTHEFDVSASYGTAQIISTISWDPGPGLIYDLDLYIDRQLDTGDWEEVQSSIEGQLLEGDPKETVTIPSAAPGHYRARVVNYASTQLDYHGVLSFTTIKAARTNKKGTSTTTRATADRPDAASGSQLHLIYFVPNGSTDNALDTNGVIVGAMGAMNQWFDAQTPGRHMRLDTWLNGGTPALDVTFVRGNQTSQQYVATGDVFTAVTDELESRGWTADPDLKRYVVYYDGPAESSGICGTAYYNYLGAYAQWSVVFLGASAGCGARDFGTPATGAGTSEAIAVQEMFHNESIARPESLHHCAANLGHLCTAQAGSQLGEFDPESVDVMFPYVTFALREKALDIDHDDYYQHPFTQADFADSPFLEP